MISDNSNPLLSDWSARPFAIPPFESIKTEHFQPAIEATMKDHLEEVKAIAENPEPATFDNTFKLYDRAGAQLNDVLGVFYNLTSSANVPELQKVQMDLAGPLADHSAAVRTTPGLFDRIRTVYEARANLDLDAQQIRLVERVYKDFVLQGALFDKVKQDEYNAIVKELALLCTKFSQNLLADEGEVVPVSLEELDGCSEEQIAAAQQAAVSAKKEGYAISLSRSMVEPFLSSCKNPEARERVFQAFVSRGELSPERDNKSLAVQILKLRSQQAALHGYESYAAYSTADTMAKTPEAVLELLNRVWTPAKDAANRERGMLAEYAKSVGDSEVIRPSDWRFYAERVRETKYDLDESIVKPYFSLDRMLEALFDVANKLYGLTFVLRPDIKAYHEDVLVYEVHEQVDGQDSIRAIFFHDNFARQYKAGGAWMSEFRSQNRNSDDLGTNVIPIVINNNNFTKAADGQPTLLSFDDCVTLFHEFGHGCHGMLSDSKYQRLASTNVLGDYVELPSQLMEHWIRHPEVLAKHAVHYQTNEPIPAELLAKLMAARKFQQGFATIEYTICALVDQSLHALPAKELATLDLAEFEKAKLAELDMPAGIVMRHRIPQFSHLFSGPGYAAGYYYYLWAEVLDADAFEAFLESGDIFDKATAARARKYIYSAGSTIDHMEGYRAFRGKDAAIEPMLKKKGLLIEA
ncbi:zincin [Rhizoclosmatium globosum]|uniref:oligopeptidase A n=1 Tax=Rhizoclosmatium globosum TaxID=329046 RepID=A0A1Y2CXR1_9FUNG|nr:zincin [Rhizoclosmatium globosum]|eukprot:ORY51624.1 zincin [Rhizoclosmatium globosum]